MRMCVCVHITMYVCGCACMCMHVATYRPQNQIGRWHTAHMVDCCQLDSLSHTQPVRRPLEIQGAPGTCDEGPLLC